MVPIETVGDGSQLVQVEVGVASDERVERPADLGDALLECLRPLGELERVPDARVPPIRQHGQHVRMGVEPVLGIDADPSEHEADRVLTVERAERDVPAVGERAEHREGRARDPATSRS